jgi:gamma-glutamyltranspeptidase/glutathione hydrolase
LLLQLLGLFSRHELRELGWNTSAYQHMLAEASRGAFFDRMTAVGDPAFVHVNTAQLLSKQHLMARKRALRLDKTRAIAQFALREHGTHHLVTADAAGNMVSLTTTVNRLFGVKAMAAQSGVVLNDELDDFTANRDVAALHLGQSPNRPRPGARPVSSMTPTLVVRHGRPILALGGSGGTAIPTSVAQVLLSVLAFDRSAQQAVAAPRFSVPTENATIALEQQAPASLQSELRGRGERILLRPRRSSAVQLVLATPEGYRAQADPRKYGSGRVERTRHAP